LWEKSAVLRRIEDRIRRLSQKLVAEQDLEKARLLAEELREELSRHIEGLRLRLAEYPVVTERREITTGSQKPHRYSGKLKLRD
jgi:signal transduction histidine kinase